VSESRARRLLVVVLALGAALRLAWQAWFAADPAAWIAHGNAAGFLRVAQRIAGGEFLAGDEPFFYGPLYPYFLAPFFALAGRETLVLPRAAQALLGLGISVLGWRIARRAFDPGAALATAALLAVYGPALFFEGLLVPTTLSTFLMLLGIDLASAALGPGDGGRAHGLRSVLAGVALGLAAWGRANLLALVPLVAVLMLAGTRRAGAAWRRAWVPALLVFAGAAGAILPVAARNTLHANDTVLLVSQGGINFFLGNNPEARGWFGLAERAGIVTDADPAYFANTRAVAEADLGRRLRPSAVSRYWLGRGWGWISAEPAAAARLLGRKLALLVDPYELPIHRNALYYLERFPAGWLLPGWGLLLPLALAGLLLVPRWEDLHTGLLAVALFYAGTVVAFFVSDRYRFPLVPLLAPFAGFAAARFVSAGARWCHGAVVPERRRLGLALGAALGAAALLHAPGFSRVGPTERAAFLAIEHYRHGRAWEEFDDVAAAIAAYEQALAVAPGHVESRLRQSVLLGRLGRVDEARAVAETLLSLRPDLDEARRVIEILDASVERARKAASPMPSSTGG